jgi:predicted nucleotidyltransferase
VTDRTARAHRTDPSSPPRLGAVTLPPLTGPLNTLWDVILDVAAAVPPHRWALIGGQMVTLHALHAGHPPLRVSRDIDVLADLLTARDGLALCVTAIRALDLLPDEGPSGRIHRFRRARDGVSVDVVAPDHTPPTWSLRTAKGRDTIQISGGRQALQRAALITVTKDDRSAHVPVPDLLGALVLKAAAWLEDSRDRERHSHDAALLTSLITDPIAERRRFRGSDRKRLLKLHAALADPHDPAWTDLGERGPDAHTTWQILIS